MSLAGNSKPLPPSRRSAAAQPRQQRKSIHHRLDKVNTHSTTPTSCLNLSSHPRCIKSGPRDSHRGVKEQVPPSSLPRIPARYVKWVGVVNGSDEVETGGQAEKSYSGAQQHFACQASTRIHKFIDPGQGFCPVDSDRALSSPRWWPNWVNPRYIRLSSGLTGRWWMLKGIGEKATQPVGIKPTSTHCMRVALTVELQPLGARCISQHARHQTLTVPLGGGRDSSG